MATSYLAKHRISYRVKPELAKTMERLGAKNIWKCFDCGSCSTSCSITCLLSEELGVIPFPRKFTKYVKLGLDDRLKSSIEPWLCYHCGECSDTCPKGADPCEIMTAIRRYLITKYDFTGISKLMYLSKAGLLAVRIALAALTLVILWLLKGPIVLERTELATFAPVSLIGAGEIAILMILTLLLLINAYRMYRLTVRDLKGIPLTKALIELIKMLGFCKKQLKSELAKCKYESFWYSHRIILCGCALALILFGPLLSLTLTNSPFLFVNPLSIIGILSTILLLIGTAMIIEGRIKKKVRVWDYSHHTDWAFIVLLLLVTLTGILTGIFRTLNYPLLTYALFAIHISTVVALSVEIPFGKLSHIIYRPLAAYIAKLQLIKRVS